MKTNLITRGDRIAYAIKQSGHTPASIARKIGCSPAAIYQWIKGETKDIRNDHLFSLAELTGFEARWIALGEGPQTRAEAKSQETFFDLYYSLDPAAQAAVLKVAESLKEYKVKEKE